MFNERVGYLFENNFNFIKVLNKYGLKILYFLTEDTFGTKNSMAFLSLKRELQSICSSKNICCARNFINVDTNSIE